jgi:hypothetical protein
MPVFDNGWVQSWQSLVNRDSVAKLYGKHFTADVMLEFGEKPYVVSFRDGQIAKVQNEIGPETTWQLALRAPAETWDKFIQPIPPPMYNDIIALSHRLHGRLKIEGDVKVMWQNLRALTWDLDLMRSVK